MSGEIVFVRCRMLPSTTAGRLAYRVTAAGGDQCDGHGAVGRFRTPLMLPLTADRVPRDGTGGFVEARLVGRAEQPGTSVVTLPGRVIVTVPNWIIGRRKGRHEPEDAA